jgi:hypothetical protein
MMYVSERRERVVIVADTKNHCMGPEFSERVEACLLESLPNVGTVRVLATPVFVEVPATCPECGSRVSCDEVTADGRNGARGQVKCTNERCSWSGLGIYRLIDVETPDEGINQSAVVDGAIEPRFSSYE